MITDKDRSGWFGASDTSYIVGNWNTASFKKWWLAKLGLHASDISTKAMKVGNAYEHEILDTIGANKDRQLLIPELRLRVNYDGDLDNHIYEVKTHKNKFKVSKQYWRQAQIEIFAWKTVYGILPKLTIVAYETTEAEYENYFKEINLERLTYHPIEYDESFVENEYLPKLRYLRDCMEKGVMPKE